MKVRIKRTLRQVSIAAIVCLALSVSMTLNSCVQKKEEKPVIPPLTFPLSQSYIGYGVINVSYTRVSGSIEESGTSVGYLRQGSVVCIRERRLVKNEGKTETWVLVEGSAKGWLKESLMDIYSNESQAVTAAEQIAGSK